MRYLCLSKTLRDNYLLFAQWLTIALLAVLLSPWPGLAAPTNEQMAWDLAQGWLQERNTRLTEGFQGELSEVKTYSDEYGEPLYFVAELTPQGYIVISADDLIEPVIAFSSSGQYVEDRNNPLTNLLKKDLKERKNRVQPAFFNKGKGKNKDKKQVKLEEKLTKRRGKSKQKWGKYKNKSQNLSPNFYQSESPEFDESELDAGEQSFDAASISDVRVAPLLPTKWNQRTSRDSNYNTYNLYNIYTPNNYYSGCVATAMAQVLRYHSYPTSGIGQITLPISINNSGTTATTRGGDGAGGAYNWAIMTLDPTSAPYNAASWNMIGALMYDAGLSVDMNYTASGSGTQMYPLLTGFKNVFQYANAERTFFYDYNDHSAEYEKTLNSNINAGFPVILGIIGSPGGHAVVADGYGYDGGTLYHHVNMGWGGSSDAWYNLPTIGSFNTVPELIYNIFPTQTGEIISGRVTDNKGNPQAGVTVTVQDQGGGPTYNDVTDANGVYGVTVPSNATYNVSADTATVSGVAIGESTTAASANRANVDVWIVPDLPADVKMDLLWRRPDTGETVAWIMDGVEPIQNLTYGTIVSAMPTYWEIQGTGDFDGDGTSDLLWRRPDSGETLVWLMNDLNPLPQISYGTIISNMPTYWEIQGVGDFDGDGKDDLLWRRPDSGETVVWLMDGTASIASLTYGTIINAMPSYWQIQGVGDFDGDGKDDLLWRRPDSGETVVWLMDGISDIGSLTYGTIINSMPSYWQIQGVGDFDGDGKDDLLWRRPDSGETIVWLMDGTTDIGGLTYGTIINSMPSYWEIQGVGDFDGDGKDDLLWRRPDSGETIVWLMDGTTDIGGLTYGTIINSMPSYWEIQGVANFNGN